MITAGVVIARDPELGMNSGIYRFIVKEKALTGIDIVTPNNMRLFAQRAFERKEPLPISISIGTHPFEITGSGYRAPLGVDEMAIAGGLRGEAVELAPCSTIDMPYIADAEIVLEAEILPTGWTWPEGRFGEFTRLMGGLHWNPLVRIKAISMRKDAIYYNLHMPWENTWLAAPTRYAAIRQALRTANVQVKDINVTLGGCAFWHAVISIKKGAGRRQERAARGAVGDGPQARRGGGRRHRRQRSDRRRMGDRHARAGRQGRRSSFPARGRSRSTRACCRARAWCRSAPKWASTPPSPRASRSSTTSASPMPMPTRRRSTTTSRARRTRSAKPATSATVETLAKEILAAIDKEPLYYTDIAERFSNLRLPHRGARARPSARDREAVAGPARQDVRAGQQVRRGAAGEEVSCRCCAARNLGAFPRARLRGRVREGAATGRTPPLHLSPASGGESRPSSSAKFLSQT